VCVTKAVGASTRELNEDSTISKSTLDVHKGGSANMQTGGSECVRVCQCVCACVRVCLCV